MTRADARPVIVWDVDDVLNDLMAEWLDGWRRTARPARPVAFEELSTNPPDPVLGIGRDDYLTSLDAFRQARYPSLQARPDVLAWFRAYGSSAQHIALTAVPRAFAHLSASWVMDRFGTWIRTFAFVPSPRNDDEPEGGDYARSKREYLAWLGQGDLLVDDREENIIDARALGLRDVLMPRPWNRARGESFDAALRRLAAFVQVAAREGHAQSF